MLSPGIVCGFALVAMQVAPLANSANVPQHATALDSEYHDFDKLVSSLRGRDARQYAIRRPGSVDEAAFVPIGGIEQWITIRGQDRANPVLLFLHGGPGDVTSCWTFSLFAPWEKYFTVVQWDQRGAGRTLEKSGPSIAPTLTVERIAQDGIELSEYLRKQLAKDKIILVAHSFGSIIGLQMVHKRPDLFFAYVGTGQVADETKTSEVAYSALLQHAHAVDNQEAISELTSIGPPPWNSSSVGYGVLREWANRFEHADDFIYGTIGLTLVAPGCSVSDINESVAGQILSGARLVPQSLSSGPKQLGLTFSVPIFFFQGAEDFTTPTALARSYLGAIRAPEKAFVTIPDAGHFAVFMRPDQFLAILVNRVRPLAVK